MAGERDSWCKAWRLSSLSVLRQLFFSHLPSLYFASNIKDDHEDERASLMDAERRRQEEQFHAQMQARAPLFLCLTPQFNQDIIREREEGVIEIERDMTEINEIFRDLSIAVHDQGGMLGLSLVFLCGSQFQDSIEANMTHADSAVENGTGQLVKASGYQVQRCFSSLSLHLHLLS